MTRSATSPEPYGYRRDRAVPAFDDAFPIIMFDGECVLCSRFVRFVLRRDRRGRMRFLAAQSPLGEALYRHLGLTIGAYETYVLLENGHARVKSDAALRIFALLGFPWHLLTIGAIAPRAWRDWLYDLVARNRYKWFGARDTCYVPTAAEAERFIA